jgi:hypothetical protein
MDHSGDDDIAYDSKVKIFHILTLLLDSNPSPVSPYGMTNESLQSQYAMSSMSQAAHVSSF